MISQNPSFIIGSVQGTWVYHQRRSKALQRVVFSERRTTLPFHHHVCSRISRERWWETADNRIYASSDGCLLDVTQCLTTTAEKVRFSQHLNNFFFLIILIHLDKPCLIGRLRRNMQGLVFQLEYIVYLQQLSFVFDIIFFTGLKIYFLELGRAEL